MNYDSLYDTKCVYKLQAKDIDELKEYFKKKMGWVYIAKSKSNPHLKIGRTGKNPMIRAKTLSSSGVLHDYDIIFSLPVFNQYWSEKQIHQKLKQFRVTSSKEFFNVSESFAIEVFQNTINAEDELLNRFLKLDVLKEDLELLEYTLK
jgi:hypothetical protein